MAYTEKYVAPGGSEPWATATSAGSPASFDEAMSNAAPGERVNVLEGSYSPTVLTQTNNGTATAPIYWRGYSSTIGDLQDVGRLSRTGKLDVSNFPVIDFGTSGTVSFGSRTILENLHLQNGHTGTNFNGLSAGFARRCLFEAKSTTNTATLETVEFGNYTSCIDCDGFHNGTRADGLQSVFSLLDRSQAIGCQAWNPSTGDGTGFNCGLFGFAYGCLAHDLTLGASVSSFASGFNRGTIYNVKSDGIKISSSQGNGVTDNIIYNVGGYAINMTSQNSVPVSNNAYGLATSGGTNGFGDIPIFDLIALTADPFTDAANGDFTLNGVAGGGAACKGVSLRGGDLGAFDAQGGGGSGGVPQIGSRLIRMQQ